MNATVEPNLGNVRSSIGPRRDDELGDQYASVPYDRSNRNNRNMRFDCLLDYDWFFIKHDRKLWSNNLQHQHVVFSIHALHLKMIQESEDVARSRMYP